MTDNVNFDDSFSKAINRLKCVLPFLIIAIHAYYPERNTYVFDYDISNDILFFLSRVITEFAVPCFFFISGYLFFLNNKKNIYQKWKERLFTLLLPYLLWNTIYLIFQVVKPYVFASFLPIEHYEWSFSVILKAFWNFHDGKFPIDGPLWYIRDLMIICIFVPVVKKLNSISPWVIILWLCLIFTYGGLFYFCLGAWCITYKKTFQIVFSKRYIFILSMGAYCVLSFLLVSVHNAYLSALNVIIAIYCAFALSMKVSMNTNSGVGRLLMETSFWVYAIHAFLITLIDKIICKIYYPNNDLVFISYFFIKIVTTYLVALGIYKILFKLTPNIVLVLIGKKLH